MYHQIEWAVQCPTTTTASKVDRLMENNLKAEHTQAAKEAHKDMLAIKYAATNKNLKGASYSSIKSNVSEMTLDGTFDDLFIKNLERWSQASKFIDAFTKNVLNSQTFTNPRTQWLRFSDNNWTIWLMSGI